MNKMIATFCMTADSLKKIAEADAKTSSSQVAVEIRPVLNGKLSTATGEAQAVMFLIGAVAANGEDTLYKAEAL